MKTLFIKVVFSVIGLLFTQISMLFCQCNSSFEFVNSPLCTQAVPILEYDSNLNYKWFIYSDEWGENASLYVVDGYNFNLCNTIYNSYHDSTLCLRVTGENCADTTCMNIDFPLYGTVTGTDGFGSFSQVIYSYTNPQSIVFQESSNSIGINENTLYGFYSDDTLMNLDFIDTLQFNELGDYEIYFLSEDTMTQARKVKRFQILISDETPYNCDANFTYAVSPGPNLLDTVWIYMEKEFPAEVELFGNDKHLFESPLFYEGLIGVPCCNYVRNDTSALLLEQGIYEICVRTLGLCQDRHCEMINVRNQEEGNFKINVMIEPSFFTTSNTYVQLFREDPNSGISVLVAEELVPAQYEWAPKVTFSNLDEAYYFIRGFRDSPNPCLRPGYPINQLFWQGSSIHLTSDHSKVINLQNCSSNIDTTGFGLVNGTFTFDNHLIIFDTLSASNFITVYLITEDESEITMKKVGFNEAFSIDKIPNGNYFFGIDYPGWEIERVPITITDDHLTEQLDISVLNGIMFVESELESSGLIKLYPNPAQDKLIVTTTQAGDLSIFSISGIEQGVKPIKKESSIELNIQELDAGVYYLKFVSQTGIVNWRRFVKR